VDDELGSAPSGSANRTLSGVIQEVRTDVSHSSTAAARRSAACELCQGLSKVVVLLLLLLVIAAAAEQACGRISGMPSL
jgi:hypothetical protein